MSVKLIYLLIVSIFNLKFALLLDSTNSFNLLKAVSAVQLPTIGSKLSSYEENIF